MQECAHRRRDRQHQSRGDSPSLSSSSKKSHSPPFISVPASSISSLQETHIEDTRCSATPQLDEIVRISVGNLSAPLEGVEEMLAHEDQLIEEDNERVLDVDIDLLVELPAPLPVPPFVVLNDFVEE